MSADQLSIEFREDARRDLARLVPIARELAARAGARGITMEDVRDAAVARHVLTGAEQGRRLSYLGALPKAAGLVSTGRRRYSKSRNPNVVFVLAQFAERGEREGAA